MLLISVSFLLTPSILFVPFVSTEHHKRLSNIISRRWFLQNPLILDLIYDKADCFWGWTDIPYTIRGDNDELILLGELEVLDFRFWDEAYSLGSEVSQASWHSNSRSFFIFPHTIGANGLFLFIHKSFDFSTFFTDTFFFSGTRRFVIPG